MGNSSDGEDAAQEAVITLARKIGTLKKAELFEAWMYRIVFNVCMDEKRKKAKKIQGSTELDVAAAIVPEHNKEVLPEANLQSMIEKEDIIAAINDLPERYRLYLLLYYYEEMTYAEIAQTMQVSEQVVANTLNRAKEKMRESFAQRDPVRAYAASKGGMLFSAAAITEALAFDEMTMVVPGAVSKLVASTAAIPVVKASLLTRFFDSSSAQITTGAACVAIIALLFGFSPPPPDVEALDPVPAVRLPIPVVEYQPPPVVRSAEVSGLPEGAQTRILVQGTDDAQLAAFFAVIDNYEYVVDAVSEGYVYTVYRNIYDSLDYVVTIVELQ
ncbi:MAG: sigma-70 family RNA polymerase sigma factor [Eggerthellaceae bacterium]|nr:sigma-70 family RNA polymerase sigma factor [Eggerthellaceae bacterium]